ncbi:hypothetical protein C8J57DRAFT_1727737 [Mycena rebaudengoi]|nr:hypothetical protein C8J57DRAFT_1727737 [Mycena rebaudengoi]
MSTGVSVEGFTPFLVAVTVCAPLWGVNVAQANAYYRSYPNDRKALKYLVLLNTAQLGVLGSTLYFWLITCRLPQNYPRLGSLKRVLSHDGYSMVSNKNKYLVSAIIFLSVTQMASGFALCSYMSTTDKITSVYSRFNHIAGSLQLGSSMLGDILITASLVYCLRGSVASFKGTPRTRNAINKIVMYSVNTGIVTNIVTMIDLITWLAAPETDFTWAVFHFALGKS